MSRRHVIYAPPVISTRTIAGLLLGALLLTGCSSVYPGDDMTRMPGEAKASPTATHEAGDETPDEAEDFPSADIPDSFRTVTAEQSGLRFSAPKAWLLLDAERIAVLAGEERLDAAAEDLGIGVEELKAMYDIVDVMVIDTEGNNINVTRAIPLAELPTAAALRAQLESMLNVDVTRVKNAETPLGRTRVCFFESSGAGRQGYGASVFVRLSTGVANLTVTALTEELRAALLENVLGSLEEVGSPGEA